MSKQEKRFLSGGELRADTDFSISGIAAPYNQKSHNLGGFIEVISPGAFARSLREGADVRCLFQHDPRQILGRTKSGTLTLTDSSAGLGFRCQLDKNSQAHTDVYGAIKRKDITDMSFAFTVPDGGDDWTGFATDETGARVQLRTLRDVDLMDVSPVCWPAYGTGTTVDARSMPDYVAGGWNTEASFQRLAARATDSINQADEQRRRRAAEVLKRITTEKRKDVAFEESCEKACRELDPPLDFCDVDQNFIYGSNPDDVSEDCLRFEYQIDDEGAVVLNEDSRTKVKHELLHSERGRKILFFKRIKRSAGGR
jgi:HK97 family phage prohead protease